MKAPFKFFFISITFLWTSCNKEIKLIDYGSNDGKWIIIRNTKVYYEEYGHGMPLLLLSGGGLDRSIKDFEKCIPELSKQYRVIAPDTPGQGRSEQADSISYGILTDFMSQFVDSLKVDSVYVMGWSDGGIVGGRTGLQLAEQALNAGHFVTAVVRSPEKFTLGHKNLYVHKGDVLDLNSFNHVMKGHDVVLSTLGATSTAPTTVYSEGVRNIIQAMNVNGVSRVIVLSALAVEINPTMALWQRLFIKFILQPILKNMYADTLKMEYILKQARLDWTIIRPPQLTNSSVTGKYRVKVGTHLPRANKISRADLAHYMLHHLFDKSTYCNTVELAY